MRSDEVSQDHRRIQLRLAKDTIYAEYITERVDTDVGGWNNAQALSAVLNLRIIFRYEPYFSEEPILLPSCITCVS